MLHLAWHLQAPGLLGSHNPILRKEHVKRFLPRVIAALPECVIIAILYPPMQKESFWVSKSPSSMGHACLWMRLRFLACNETWNDLTGVCCIVI